MKALLLTNEYPPYIYGGAGVHIDYLSRELAKIMEVEVRSFGDQETDLPNLKGYRRNSVGPAGSGRSKSSAGQRLRLKRKRCTSR